MDYGFPKFGYGSYFAVVFFAVKCRFSFVLLGFQKHESNKCKRTTWFHAFFV